MTPEKMMELAVELEAWSRNISDIPWSPWRLATRIKLEKAAKALRASAVGAGAREASRLLNKIVDLADDENAVDPLDDAIEYAKKALATLQSEPVQAAKCSHPNAVVWFYRDDDTFMRCPDCKAKFVALPSDPVRRTTQQGGDK